MSTNAITPVKIGFKTADFMHIYLWNENQLMSLFYSYIAGSLRIK